MPYLSQIWLWVFHGRLQPLPADTLEFFIVSSKGAQGRQHGNALLASGIDVVPPSLQSSFGIQAVKNGSERLITFPAASGALGHGKMWREGYRLEDSMRSPFISQALAQRILRAGKGLNFLR